MSVAFVTNIPAPYREKVHAYVAQKVPGYTVVYCQDREADRKWDLPVVDYERCFLKSRAFQYHNGFARHVHFNPDVWSTLNRLAPRVVITNGFNPTHLLAFLWAKTHGAKHIAFTDGYLEYESDLTWAHRLLRRIVYGASVSGIGASCKSMELLVHYGISPDRVFQSHLCADNDAYGSAVPFNERPFDLMFAGQMVERKMPLFFAEVAEAVHRQRPIRVLVLGDGPLKAELLGALERAQVPYVYGGFASQAELPAHYASSKLFLFPSQIDCWGVVANEACAAGTPVLTTPSTGVAGELVVEGVSGRVLPPDALLWTTAILDLLQSDVRWKAFSEQSRSLVADYHYNNAGLGIVNAIRASGIGEIS